MNDYKWNILTLRIVEEQHIVSEIVWSVKYEGKVYVSSTELIVNWENFIPYELLSESKVIEWIKNNMSENIQKSITTYFEIQ